MLSQRHPFLNIKSNFKSSVYVYPASLSRSYTLLLTMNCTLLFRIHPFSPHSSSKFSPSYFLNFAFLTTQTDIKIFFRVFSIKYFFWHSFSENVYRMQRSEISWMDAIYWSLFILSPFINQQSKNARYKLFKKFNCLLTMFNRHNLHIVKYK
jgi:hypothetical protein